jgi:hypothetical protein
MKLKLTERAISRRSLVTYVTLVIMVVGIGSYLWLKRSEGTEFILQAIGIALAVSLAAEEIIRLRDFPPRRNPSVEAKGKVDA